MSISSDGYGKLPALEQVPTLFGKLNNLDQELGILCESLERLNSRLDPILDQRPSDAKAEIPPDPRGIGLPPALSEVDRLCLCVRGARIHVDSLTDKLML